MLSLYSDADGGFTSVMECYCSNRATSANYYQDWSVNYVRKLKCQPCMEAAQLVNLHITRLHLLQ
jgi:hypothetical protein